MFHPLTLCLEDCCGSGGGGGGGGGGADDGEVGLLLCIKKPKILGCLLPSIELGYIGLLQDKTMCTGTVSITVAYVFNFF